jgi:hypothetical protein
MRAMKIEKGSKMEDPIAKTPIRGTEAINRMIEAITSKAKEVIPNKMTGTTRAEISSGSQITCRITCREENSMTVSVVGDVEGEEIGVETGGEGAAGGGEGK